MHRKGIHILAYDSSSSDNTDYDMYDFKDIVM